MPVSNTLSRRAFVKAAVALAAGTLTVGLVGCNKEDEKKDRADEDIAWQYMTADELIAKLDGNEAVIVLDIRPDDMYNAGHIKGAYHVASFPVETAEQEKALKDAAKNLQGDDPIVIVCRSGNKGAKRTISVLQEEGIKAERLFILEGGGEGWSSEEWTTTENDSTVPGSEK